MKRMFARVFAALVAVFRAWVRVVEALAYLIETPVRPLIRRHRHRVALQYRDMADHAAGIPGLEGAAVDLSALADRYEPHQYR